MPTHITTPTKQIERNQRIVELWSTGLTLQEVGNKFGMTRERVRQIVNRCDEKYTIIRDAAKDAWRGPAMELLASGMKTQDVASQINKPHWKIRRLFSLVSRPSKEARFWARVDQSGGIDACWPWTGYRTSYGYGHCSLRWLKDSNCSAHRAAWRLANNSGIPGHLHVLHRCDNPPCCNPAHLYLGTPAQNAKDSLERGKRRVGIKSRITEDTKQQVVEDYLAGLSGPKIAHARQLDTPTIYRVLDRAGVKRRTFEHKTAS